MTFKYSVLNVPATLFIVGCLIYTGLKYKTLSYEEGWGVVYMVGLCGLGLLLLIIDFVVQNIFKKNKTTVIIIEAVVLVAAIVSLFLRV